MTSASTKPSPQTSDKPRRFYGAVAVTDLADGYGVVLDGRPARTPAGAALALPTRALADVVADEWDSQVGVIDFSAMLATRLAFTGIDSDADGFRGMVEEVKRYAASDLLCYFADGPEALLAQEVAHWGPVLDWAQASLGLSFVRASGVVHRAQPPETVEQVGALAQGAGPFAAAGLAFGVGLFGSAILALAVQRAMLSGEAAFELSRLDEAYQAQRWGVDAEAAARTEALRLQAVVLQRWFQALRDPDGAA